MNLKQIEFPGADWDYELHFIESALKHYLCDIKLTASNPARVYVRGGRRGRPDDGGPVVIEVTGLDGERFEVDWASIERINVL